MTAHDRSRQESLRALCAGIDEAGYGPRLGPLCVAVCAFEVPIGPTGPDAAVNEDRATGRLAAAPDLWSRLAASISRDPKAARSGKVVIADSKALMGKRDRSLALLERGVLAFACMLGLDTSTDGSLAASLQAGALSGPWYAVADAPLPRDESAERQRLLTRAVAQACEEAAIRPVMLRCAALDESRFNDLCDREGVKSRVSFSLVARHLAAVWERLGPDLPGLVAIDRQGGRTHYLRELAAALPGAGVSIVSESDELSVYSVRGAGGRRMTVEFRVEAESAHFAVALASMTAKYVRELSMARFNRYWCARAPELKPTAGYALDATRWLADVRAHAREEEITSMIRRL